MRVCLLEISAQVWQLDRWVGDSHECLARGHMEETLDPGHLHPERPLWGWWWWFAVHLGFVHGPVRAGKKKKNIRCTQCSLQSDDTIDTIVPDCRHLTSLFVEHLLQKTCICKYFLLPFETSTVFQLKLLPVLYPGLFPEFNNYPFEI